MSGEIQISIIDISSAQTVPVRVADSLGLELPIRDAELGEITLSAQTIRSGGETMLKQAALIRESINDRIELLGKKVQEPKDLLGETGEA